MTVSDNICIRKWLINPSKNSLENVIYRLNEMSNNMSYARLYDSFMECRPHSL